jgi:hypothetical protein
MYTLNRNDKMALRLHVQNEGRYHDNALAQGCLFFIRSLRSSTEVQSMSKRKQAQDVEEMSSRIVPLTTRSGAIISRYFGNTLHQAGSDMG